MKYTSDEMKFIRENIKIEDEIAKHLELHKKGSKYAGLCPFHRDDKWKLDVNPAKQIFGCFVCGFHGNVIKFIEAFLHLNKKEASTYLILHNENLHQRFGYSGKGKVYVLKLDSDKFYIGYTENFSNRMNSHFSGQGAKWTQENAPEEIYRVFDNVNERFENELTKIYIDLYRLQKVRGGEYVSRTLQHDDIKKEINNKTNEGVFVLLLEGNKYYVDYAVNLPSEIQKHFNGNGCEWTQKYKPLKILKQIRTRNHEETKKVIIDYIKEHGWDNVRGYRWKKIDIKMPILEELNA